MSVQWVDVKSEKELNILSNVKFDIEKCGSDIIAVIVNVDGVLFRIAKKDSFSSSIGLFIQDDQYKVREMFTVIAKKDNQFLESSWVTYSEAEFAQESLERDDWEAEVVKTEHKVKIDIISNKEEDIPF